MKRFKKALAIICAGAMAFTAMPLQVFAAPWASAAAIDVALSGVPRRVPGRTVFFEQWSPGGTLGGVNLNGTVIDQASTVARRANEGTPYTTNIQAFGAAGGAPAAEFFAEAVYLQLAFPIDQVMRDLTEFDSAGLDLVLENAHWAYNLINNRSPHFVSAADRANYFHTGTLLAGNLLMSTGATTIPSAWGSTDHGNLRGTWGGGVYGYRSTIETQHFPFSIAFPSNSSSVAYLMIHNVAAVLQNTVNYFAAAPAGTTPAGTSPDGTTPAGTTPYGTTPAGTTPSGTPAPTTPPPTTPAPTTGPNADYGDAEIQYLIEAVLLAMIGFNSALNVLLPAIGDLLDELSDVTRAEAVYSAIGVLNTARTSVETALDNLENAIAAAPAFVPLNQNTWAFIADIRIAINIFPPVPAGAPTDEAEIAVLIGIIHTPEVGAALDVWVSVSVSVVTYWNAQPEIPPDRLPNVTPPDDPSFAFPEPPAVTTPPLGTPPVGTPPAGTPPVGTPPAGTPPVGTPPAGTPPVGTTPAGTTPAGTPVTTTPVTTTPVTTTPVTTTPTTTTPTAPPPADLVSEANAAIDAAETALATAVGPLSDPSNAGLFGALSGLLAPDPTDPAAISTASASLRTAIEGLVYATGTLSLLETALEAALPHLPGYYPTGPHTPASPAYAVANLLEDIGTVIAAISAATGAVNWGNTLGSYLIDILADDSVSAVNIFELLGSILGDLADLNGPLAVAFADFAPFVIGVEPLPAIENVRTTTLARADGTTGGMFPAIHGPGLEIHNVFVWADDEGYATHVILQIPLVTRTLDEGNAVVQLRNARGLVLPAAHDIIFATSLTGGTVAEVFGGTPRRQINLHTMEIDIRVRELVGGALPAIGAIEFVAPRGFVWARSWDVTPFSANSNGIRTYGSRLVQPETTFSRTFWEEDTVLRVDYTNLAVTGAGRPPAYLEFHGFRLRAIDVDNPPTGEVEILVRSGINRPAITWGGSGVNMIPRVQHDRWYGAHAATEGRGFRPTMLHTAVTVDGQPAGTTFSLLNADNVNHLVGRHADVARELRRAYLASWNLFSAWEFANLGLATGIRPSHINPNYYDSVSVAPSGAFANLTWGEVSYWRRYPWGPGLRQPREVYYINIDFGGGQIGGLEARRTVTEDTVNFTLAGLELRLTVQTDDIPLLISGRFDDGFMERPRIDADEHRAARVRVSETLRNAWAVEQNSILVLPEGVTVRAAYVVGSSAAAYNFNNLIATDIRGNTFYNTNTPGQALRINHNTITLSGLDRTAGIGAAAFSLDLYLSIAADFEGDITLEVQNSRGEALSNEVVIAEAIPPIRVEVDTINNIRVGDQFIAVQGFRIIENVAGGLLRGHEVFISLADEVFSELHLVPAADFSNQRDVTTYPAQRDGGIQIDNVRIHNLIGGFQHGRDQAHISFEVVRESTEPSTISFTNLTVRVAATTPSNATYDLFVWGPAVASNFNHHAIFGSHGARFPELPTTAQFTAAYRILREGGGIGMDQFLINRRDLFEVPGIRTPFAEIGDGRAEGGAADPMVRYTVTIQIGASYITVGDRQVNISPAALVDATGTGMFPLRAISEALDIPVNWCPVSSTAFIGRNSEIEFVSGSTMMRVNGLPLPIRNGAGVDVSATIINESMFIPLRALGYAMNMTVSWDAATSTAILTP